MSDGPQGSPDARAAVPRVLVVEDEALIALDYTVTLEGMGFEVCAIASTGAEALKHAAAHQPDVILMDVNIRGDLDGIETAHRIRDAGIRSAIIFVTAFGDPETVARMKAFAPHGYLRKPVMPEDLERAIIRALKGDDD